MSTLSQLKKQIEQQDAQIEALTAFVRDRNLRLPAEMVEELNEAIDAIPDAPAAAKAPIPVPTGIRA